MRRLFLILLLSMLSLQASWASVCVCGPAQCVLDQGASELTTQDSDESASADDDCTCCQLGGMGVATAPPVSRVIAPQINPAAGDGSELLAFLRPDRPERPKWMRAS